MTDEEMAEKYCNEEVPFDVTESGVKLYTEQDLKYAYLAALKAGSQLDKVWHDYDAGEDCHEDSHEGKWVKREDNKPKWHKVADGDLPSVCSIVLDECCNKVWYVGNGKWLTYSEFYEKTIGTNPPIAWCEEPEYTED